jgi:hypothetical protein
MSPGKFDHSRGVGVDIKSRLKIFAKIFRIPIYHGKPLDRAMGLPAGRARVQKLPALCRFFSRLGEGNNRTMQMRHGQDNAILKSIQGVKREGGLVKIHVPESCQCGFYFA